MSTTEIEWGFNCLTDGVHHGRPEALWNLPLLQTTYMFTPVQLQLLVMDRIYNDAMQFVKHSPFTYTQKGTEETAKYTFLPVWAEIVRKEAGPKILPVYKEKVDEITNYYRSSAFKTDIDGVVERNKVGKLNPHYQPLHGHDTLNLLCRIVGQEAKRGADFYPDLRRID